MSPEERQRAHDAAAGEVICTLGRDPSVIVDPYARTYRVRHGLGPGTVLRGYPSELGGVYVLEGVLGVELEFLGLGRFETTERRDSDLDSEEARREEDEWCAKLRKLGAVWWESEADYDWSNFEGTYGQGEGSLMKVGYPASGGVWVLKMSIEEADKKGAGIIYNAFTMEERCMVIEKLGGVFYSNPMECPDLDLAGKMGPARKSRRKRQEEEIKRRLEEAKKIGQEKEKEKKRGWRWNWF